MDGRQVRFLNLVDEFTREALATRAFRSCTSDRMTQELDRIIARTGRKPAHIRVDNGTETTAHAMRDWCRFTGADASFIDPGSPWQNGICESFNGRSRAEFLNCEVFQSLAEVQVLANDWRIEYNSYRPHGSLGFRTLEAFRAQWLEVKVRSGVATHIISGPQSGPSHARDVSPKIGDDCPCPHDDRISPRRMLSPVQRWGRVGCQHRPM